MNKSLPLILAAVLFLAVAAHSASATIVSISATNGGLMADSYTDTNDPTSNFGGNDMRLGVSGTSVGNMSIIIQFSTNSTFVPTGSVITSAMLYIMKKADLSGQNDCRLNLSMQSSNDQTWLESTVNQNSVNSQILAAINNVTQVALNTTCATVGSSCYLADNNWLAINVTSKVQWFMANGYLNVTFYLNQTAQPTAVNTCRFSFFSKETGAAQQKAQLNITYIPLNGIASPLPYGIYNSNSIQLNVTNSTPIQQCIYSNNGGQPLYFMPNTVFLASNGLNSIEVDCEDYSNSWTNNTIQFTVTHPCDAIHVYNTTCGGDLLSSVLTCRQFSLSGYQWDSTNVTYCPNGCFDGNCIQRFAVNRSTCNINESYCTSQNELTNCVLYPDKGVYDWNTSLTVCQYGCMAGRCNSPINKCVPYESRCRIIGGQDYIDYCTDDIGAGIFDYSNINKTFCSMGCKEEYFQSTGMYNATCNFHSFNDVEAFRQALINITGPVFAPFDFSAPTRWFLWFVITMLLTGGALVITRSWQLSFIGMLLMMFSGAAINWFPVYIPILLAILIGFMIYSMRDNDG